VVYSKEEPLKPNQVEKIKAEVDLQVSDNVEVGVAAKKRVTPGSIAFVPSVVGLIIASEVVKDLAGVNK